MKLAAIGLAVFLSVPLLLQEKAALFFLRFAGGSSNENTEYCVKAVLTEVSELQKTHFPIGKKYAQSLGELSYDLPPICKTHWKYFFQLSPDSIGYTLTAQSLLTSEEYSINEKEVIFLRDRTSPQMPE